MQKVLTDIFSSPAVYVKRIVAKLVVGVGSLKKKSIGTKFLLWDLSNTFIVFVTLLGVGEETIFLRAKELHI